MVLHVRIVRVVVRCPCWVALFFVRVNQVLVRLWARRGRMSDRMAMGFGPSASSDPAAFRGVKRSHWIVFSGSRPSGGERRGCATMRSCCVLSERSAVSRTASGGAVGGMAGADFGLTTGDRQPATASEAGFCAWWRSPERSGGKSVLEREKGIRWMPWHQEAMKDVARCEKPRGAASRR